MANIRQVVVIRRDLNMTPGLIAAQVAHIGDAWMRKRILFDTQQNCDWLDHEIEWMRDPYISVLAVDNPEELDIVCEEAEDAGLKVNVWSDLIPSVNLKRNMTNTTVGCSIGPDDFDKIKAITGNLPLA